jgi:hypothetical protein
VLTRQLDAVIGTPAVIGLDPMIVASIQVLGSAAPASAIGWLDQLRTSGNEIFALAYADADLASLAQANALNLREPIDFDFAIDPRNFGPAASASPTPSPAATSTEPPADGGGARPPLPTDASEVLAWSYTLDDIAWPASPTPGSPPWCGRPCTRAIPRGRTTRSSGSTPRSEEWRPSLPVAPWSPLSTAGGRSAHSTCPPSSTTWTSRPR